MHEDQQDYNGFVDKAGLGLDNGHHNTDHHDRMMHNLLSRVDIVSSYDQRVGDNNQLDSPMLLVSTTLLLLLLQVHKYLDMKALLTKRKDDAEFFW